MDPNECLRLLLTTDDPEEMAEHACNLKEWIGWGGAVPRLTPELTRSLALRMIALAGWQRGVFTHS